jgi:hypothetical protein
LSNSSASPGRLCSSSIAACRSIDNFDRERASGVVGHQMMM